MIMPKILLINPPFNIAKISYDTSLSVGLLSIASLLDSRGMSVEILDGARQADFERRLRSELPNCPLVAFSVMTMQVGQALKISQLIKEINPDCRIIWGGPHPTFFPEQTVKNDLIDLVCVGEGEDPLLELVASMKSGAIDHSIRNIWFKNNGTILRNPARPLMQDLDSLPFPDKDLFRQYGCFSERLYVMTGRGCPYQCTYCFHKSTSRKKLRGF